MGRPPFTKWSDTDHSGPVIIATVLSLVYWAAPGIGHQVISFKQTNVGSWADYSYIAAMILGLCQSIVVLVASSHGLGKSVKILQVGEVQESLRLYHASSFLYILVLALAKWSTTCAIINLTVPTRGSIKRAAWRYKFIFWVVSALTVAWACGSIIALSVQCKGGGAGSLLEDKCDLKPTWAGIFAADAATDLTIVGFAASIIMPTHARVRLKLIWYSPFFIRLGSIVLSGLRLAAFYPESIQRDPTIGLWLFVVLTQVSIFLSLIAAGFPALKKTILDLVTNFGVSEETANSSRKGPSFGLSSLSKKNKQSSAQRSSPSFKPYTGWSTGSTVAEATAKENASDDGSQKGIMRRDVIEVTHSYTIEVEGR